MSQNMCGKGKIGVLSKLTKHKINCTRGKSSPFEAKKQSRLRKLRETFGTVLEPCLENLTHFRIERHFTVGLSLPRSHNHDALTSRNEHIVHIQSRTLTQTQSGVEQKMR